MPAARLAGCQTDAVATQPNAVRPADSKPVTKTVYVAPQSARCTGVAPMECLQVRNGPNEPWSLWYAGIEGFAYQPGYLYTLEIDEYRVAQPPADGSSIRWVLAAPSSAARRTDGRAHADGRAAALAGGAAVSIRRNTTDDNSVTTPMHVNDSMNPCAIGPQ